jgi:hypothetical protein
MGRGRAVVRELVLKHGQYVDDPFAGVLLGPPP